MIETATGEVAELAWLFEEYESAIGVRSVQSSFMSKMGGVFTTNRWESEDQAFAAVRRARPIVRALDSLDARHRRVIRLAYSLRTWPPDVVGNYGRRLAGIVSTMKPPAEIKGQTATKLWAAIKLSEAHEAFRTAKQQTRKDRRWQKTTNERAAR